MINVLKSYTFLCLFVALPVVAFDGDYILEERFQTNLVNAKNGEAQAQYAVGEMYRRGKGIEASDKEALNWFMHAASQGDLRASYKVAYIYLHSTTVSQAPQKALPWLEISAKSGYPPAQYELGLLYTSHNGVKKDNARALTLLGKAKLAGYQPANRAFNKVMDSLKKKKRNVPKPAPNATQSFDAPQVAESRFRPKMVVLNNGPRRMIMAKRWDSDSGPSSYLPSNITDCREFTTYIECLSSELTKQVLGAEVVYRVRTRISDIKENGRFRLAYANNVISATNNSGTRAMKIKTGWQITERKMECSMDAGQSILCSRGNSREFRYSGR